MSKFRNCTSSIQIALKTCNIDEVKKAIDSEYDRINEVDVDLGWSPLYKSVLYGNENIVSILLDKGADPNIKNKSGDTALHLCIENEQLDILKLLLLCSQTDINIKGPEGIVPLHSACFKNKDEFVECLINNGANIDAQNDNGTTALHIAVEEGNTKILKMLLNKKPNLWICDKEGKNVWDYCNDKRCRSILEEYENSCINPLDDSVENGRTQPILEIEEQNKQQQIDTNVLKKNWDKQIQGLQKNIQEVAKLKEGVTKTLQELKRKEETIQSHRNISDQIIMEDKENMEVLSNKRETIRSVEEERFSNKRFNSTIKAYQKRDSVNSFKDSSYQIKDELQNTQQMRDSSRSQQYFKHESNDQVSSQHGRCNFGSVCVDVADNERNSIRSSNPYSNQNKRMENSQKEVLKVKQIKTISQWLREIKLENLLQNFIDNNVYDNQSLLQFLNNCQNWDKLLINLFGIDKYGYRHRIIIKILEGILQ